MKFEVLGLLVDFGLVVLIWMVQLLVYPSFLYYSKENLIRWHRTYTPAIGYIVGPLMLAQLGLSLYRLSISTTLLPWAHLLLVLALWMITYLQFVPRHQAIAAGTFDQTLLKGLVAKNWLRTALWTLVFLLGLGEYVR